MIRNKNGFSVDSRICSAFMEMLTKIPNFMQKAHINVLQYNINMRFTMD